jgi:hypothetical protein
VSMPGDFVNLLLTEMLAAFTAMHPAVSLELDLSPRRKGCAVWRSTNWKGGSPRCWSLPTRRASRC